MQTTSTEDSDYVNAVFTPQIAMELEFNVDTLETPNATTGSTQKKRRHSKSPTDATTVSDRSTVKKQRNQDENTLANAMTDNIGTKSELYFLTQNDITNIMEGRSDQSTSVESPQPSEEKCPQEQDPNKCVRTNSTVSDFEETSPSSAKKDTTLLSMLRNIKNRIKESNKSPKAHRSTATMVLLSAPSDDTTQAQFEDDDTSKSHTTQNLALENNRMLKTALMEIRQNGSSIDCVSERMNEIESLMEKSLTLVDSRLGNCETKTQELAENMDSKFREMRSYTNDSVTSLDQKLVTGLSTLESAWSDYKKEVQLQITEKINAGIEKALNSTAHGIRTNSAIDARLAHLKIDTEKTTTDISARLSERMDKWHNTHCEKTKTETSELRQLLSQLKAGANTPPVNRSGSEVTKEEWYAYKSRSDQSAARLDSLTVELRKYSRKTDSLDNKSRRSNVIIDMLSERESEDTKQLIEEILDQGLNENDRKSIKIKRAFRLGTKRPYVKTPRKIFLELAEPQDRDKLIQYSKHITKNGNNGLPYYINEDVNEDTKRKKADQHKYVKYLEEKGRRVEKAGEDIIVNGVRWKSADFNRLPVGDRIMDSRTIFARGTVAFQSALSPLSNLFPCNILFEGIRYGSAEQAYQHQRALHHNLLPLARDLLAQHNPYDIFNDAKEITDNKEWLDKRLPLMERLIRHKFEQVPVFADLLRMTGSHVLVENTFNLFWGSGCPFKSPLVWTSAFPGQNHLGRILERVRSSV